MPTLTRYFVALPLAYVLASYLITLLGERRLNSLAATENSYFELLGAFTLLGAAMLFVVAYVRSRRQARPATRAKRLSYLVLALAFLLAAGEELSWGQHLVGYETPESLIMTNRQHETNFHNLEFLRGGPNQLFTALWFGFTILLPLTALVWRSRRRSLDRLLPILPFAFGVLFAVNYAASKVAEAVTSAGSHHAVVEIKESNLGVLFLLVGVNVVAEAAREPLRSALAPSLAVKSLPVGSAAPGGLEGTT